MICEHSEYSLEMLQQASEEQYLKAIHDAEEDLHDASFPECPLEIVKLLLDEDRLKEVVTKLKLKAFK